MRQIEKPVRIKSYKPPIFRVGTPDKPYYYRTIELSIRVSSIDSQKHGKEEMVQRKTRLPVGAGNDVKDWGRQ